MPEKANIFVGICYHKPAPVIETGFLKPVHVGAAGARQPLAFAQPDNTGPNISGKNPTWCELTALYWMRHNVEADIYGLMHYRRLFNFDQRAKGTRSFHDATPETFRRHGWTDEAIRARLEGVDILAPQLSRTHLPGMPEHRLSNEALYARAHHHADLARIEALVQQHSPWIYPFFVQMLNDDQAHCYNISMMRREYFHPYVDWMVDILERAEAATDISGHDPYQRRVWGFLAERLTDTYIRYASQSEGARLRYLPLAQGACAPNPVPATEIRARTRSRIKTAQGAGVPGQGTGEDPLNVVMAIDTAYAPHAGAAIHSALVEARTPARYRFHILNDGRLSASSRSGLEELTARFGAKVQFHNVDDAALRWLPMNRAHISRATYYRLVMADLLPPEIRKVIYLDADVIVTAPLEELWQIDLEGRPIAGAPDEGGVQQARRLGLSLTHQYFNAGVLVFDLQALRARALHQQIMDTMRRLGSVLTLQDQDLLNVIFQNESHRLHLRWNANNRLYVPNVLDAAYSDQEAAEAAWAPAIVHFTDSRKPWQYKSINPLTPLYWLHRNATPWRETPVKAWLRTTKTSLYALLSTKARRAASDTTPRQAQEGMRGTAS